MQTDDKRQSEWTREDWWARAAEVLGWEWSPAYNGYIRADYHPDGPRDQFRSYPSDLEAEDVCDRDGVETLGDAVKLVLDSQNEGHASEDDYFAVMSKFFGSEAA